MDLTQALESELEAVLGPRFVGMFRYGAVCFPPSPLTDYDAHVLVDGPFDDDDRAAVNAAIDRIVASNGVAREDIDVWYVTSDAAGSADPPQTELRPGFRDDAWALHRAHWHAGRFIAVRGPDPRTIVPQPTWEEIDVSLQAALDDAAGDRTDDLGAYGALNLCRVLYSYETRDPVIGKFQAALWAHGYLDAGHHGVIRDAIEAYRRHSPGEKVARHGFRELLVGAIARARAIS